MVIRKSLKRRLTILEETRMTTREYVAGSGYRKPYNMWARIDYVSGVTTVSLRGYVSGGTLTLYDSEILLEKLP